MTAPPAQAPTLKSAAADPTPAAKSVAKPVPKSKRKFGIALYQAWCKRCGICGEFCPTGSIVNDDLGMPSVADEGKCVGCMQCMQRCPDFCVEVHEKAAAPAPASGVAKSGPKE